MTSPINWPIKYAWGRDTVNICDVLLSNALVQLWEQFNFPNLMKLEVEEGGLSAWTDA